MNSSINLIPLFAKNFCVGNLGCSLHELEAILNLIKKEKFKDIDFPQNDEKNNLSEISKNFYLFEQTPYLFLKSKILNYVNEFFKTILHYDKNDFVITTSWITKTSPGKYSQWHNHNNCFYSGVFYVDTDRNCGNISFQLFDNKRFSIESNVKTLYNSDNFSVPVENDRIVLFPSEVYHKINLNASNKDRWSIAFNIMPSGKIGNSDSCLIYKS
jgi:uncharacterized protein (TIGR02466 family)